MSDRALPPGRIREHYRRANPVYQALATVDDYPTIGLNDLHGWYITRENDDPDERDAGYDQVGRVATLDRDLDDILDRLDRVLYVVTTYKDANALRQTCPCTYDEENGTVWLNDEKPLPGYDDIWAASIWGDVDLADELKPQRGDLDTETRATVEATLAAYADEFATLYGTPEAVYALDSVGGAYLFGAPEATLPIAELFAEDADARARVMNAFVDRSNAWLEDAETRVNDQIDGAVDVIQPDWVNNKNRQYKAPLSLHAGHDAVVTPLDPGNPTYTLTTFDGVDDQLIADATTWADAYTAVEHTDCVESLVAHLWPDYYADAGDWQDALETWVCEEREQERERNRHRREATERRAEHQPPTNIDADLTGVPITPDIREVHAAIDSLDIEAVAEATIVHQWTDEAPGKPDTSGVGKRAFIPTWGPDANGTANYVDEKGVWVDTGANHHGTAVEMALISTEGWSRGEIAEGADWSRGVDELRRLGFEIPVWTPQARTPKPDGSTYECMPFWAVRKAAVALDVCAPDAFIERENEDCGTYPGFPDAETYNAALDAIADAGLDHDRDLVDADPEYPVYSVEGIEDVMVHVKPLSGTHVQLVVMQDGYEVYSSREKRGFWETQNYRNQIAGDIAGTVSGVGRPTLETGMQRVLNELASDSTREAFDAQLRSFRERELRERTKVVVCYPSDDGETVFKITMTPAPDRSSVGEQTLELNPGEIQNAKGNAFKTAHVSTFLTKVELDKVEWANLTDYWLDIADVRDHEMNHREEAAIEMFMSAVNNQLTVVGDEAAFDWDAPRALYAETYRDAQDVVLVPGRWVVKWKKDQGFEDIKLSLRLREADLMLGSTHRKTINGDPASVWPITAAETVHTAENALQTDDLDEPAGVSV